MTEYIDSVGLVISIDPIAVDLGWATISWYGLFFSAGLAVGLVVAFRVGRQWHLSSDLVWTSFLLAVLGGFIGGRLFHALDKLDYYIERMSEVLWLGPGGLSMPGAVVGGIVALGLVARLGHLNAAPLLITAAWATIAGQIVGRVGSLINGDSWGIPIDSWFSFIYTHPDAGVPPQLLGVSTAPYPVYESLWNLATLGLLWMPAFRRLRAPAQSALAIAGFAAGRLLLGGIRQESIIAFGLQQAQLVSLVTLLVAIPWLVYAMTVSGRGDASA